MWTLFIMELLTKLQIFRFASCYYGITLRYLKDRGNALDIGFSDLEWFPLKCLSEYILLQKQTHLT